MHRLDLPQPVQPESRAAYRCLLSQGWTDAIRALYPKEPMYTFWDYMRKRWERDGGLRLDHILLSAALRERLRDAGVDRHARRMEGASDHAPVWVKLRDAPDRGGAPLGRASGQTTIAAATSLPETERSTHRTGDVTERRSRAARTGQPAPSGRSAKANSAPSSLELRVIHTTRRSALGYGIAGDHRLSFAHSSSESYLSDDFGFRRETSELAKAVAFVAGGIKLAQIVLSDRYV
jgi:hypothetical protein